MTQRPLTPEEERVQRMQRALGGAGVLAPGINSWSAAAAVLAHLDAFDRAARAASPTPDALRRWIENVHEDANGLIWTTRTELRALATAPPPQPEAGSPLDFAVWGLRSEFARSGPPAVVSRFAVWRLLRGSDEEFERVFAEAPPPQEPPADSGLERLLRDLVVTVGDYMWEVSARDDHGKCRKCDAPEGQPHIGTCVVMRLSRAHLAAADLLWWLDHPNTVSDRDTTPEPGS